MKRAIAVIAALVAAAALGTACSGDTGDEGTSRTATNSTQGTPTEREAPPGPDLIAKEIGEEGGWNCTDANDPCSIEFTVTEIEPIDPAVCSDTAPAPLNSRVVRLSVDAQANYPTPEPNDHVAPGHIISSDNWYGVDPDGYGTKAEVMVGCGDYSPGPFYEWLNVGQKGRGSIIFSLPEETDRLQLRTSDGFAWEWQLPPWR